MLMHKNHAMHAAAWIEPADVVVRALNTPIGYIGLRSLYTAGGSHRVFWLQEEQTLSSELSLLVHHGIAQRRVERCRDAPTPAY